MTLRRPALPALLLAALAGVSAGTAQARSRFDRAAWQADFRTLKSALEHRYGHLAWFASPEGGVDLPALERKTARALAAARDDAEAQAALQAFVSGFHDGHMTASVQSPPPAAGATPPAEPPPAEAPPDARTACAAWGYAPMARTPFTLPIESLPGFTLLSDGLYDAFRVGVITVGARRLGVMRIPRFRAAEYASLCERVWAAQTARGVAPTRKGVAAEVDAAWLDTLAGRLRDLRARGVAAVLVDVGDNGGGNDLGDWAVRLFTPAPVRSAPMRMSQGPVAIPYFDVQLEDLRKALAETPALPEATRAALASGVAAFERRKVEAAAPPCDMSWVWRERRAWGTSTCTGLMDGGFSSGHLDYVAPGTLDPRAAPALYWAAVADGVRGAWDGPTYVLTDPYTGSAAELFTALMHDRGVARTIGGRTRGLGCGFVDFDEPYVLPHGRLGVRIPNCARLRADGTDDVGGVAPDLPVSARPGESPRGVALRVIETIIADLPAAR